jgi:uncharacterized membrane protein
MAALLSNFRNTVIVSCLLALALIIAFVPQSNIAESPHEILAHAGMRWLHVFFGILWIGLLYYFNFVQIRTMPKIPDELKPAVGKFIAPEALFWFRWAALLTLATGILVAVGRGYLVDAYLLGALGGGPGTTFIGIGMWLATIMFINVWFVIWPNQQRALNINNAYPDLKPEEKQKAARTAMLFSRTNMLLSIPMLAAMAMRQTMWG